METEMLILTEHLYSLTIFLLLSDSVCTEPGGDQDKHRTGRCAQGCLYSYHGEMALLILFCVLLSFRF
jgi:hypothetical protein